MTKMVSADTDLCYSPDDEDDCGKGWYLHKYVGRYKSTTSQLFSSGEEATEALHAGKVKWDAIR